MKKIKLMVFSVLGILFMNCEGLKIPLQAEFEKSLGLNKKTNYDLLIAGGAALAAGSDEQISQEEMFDVTFSLGDSYGAGYHDATMAPWYQGIAYPNLIVKQAFPDDPTKYLSANQYYYGIDLYEIPYIDPVYSDLGNMCDIEMLLSGGKTIHNPDTLGPDCETVLMNDALNGILIKPAPADARRLNWSIPGWTYTDQLHVSGVCAHKYGVNPDDPTDDCADGAPGVDAQLGYNHSTLTAVEKAESVKPTFVNESTAGNHVLCAALAMNNDCITPGVGDDFMGRTPEQSFLEDSEEVFRRMGSIDTVKGGVIWNVPYVSLIPYMKPWNDAVDYAQQCNDGKPDEDNLDDGQDVQAIEIGTYCFNDNATPGDLADDIRIDCNRNGTLATALIPSDSDSDGNITCGFEGSEFSNSLLVGVEGCSYSALEGEVSSVVTRSDRNGNYSTTYTCDPVTVSPKGADRGNKFTGRTGFYVTDVTSADMILDSEEQDQLVQFTDMMNQHLLDLSIQYNVAYTDLLGILGKILIDGGRPIVNPESDEVVGYIQLNWPLPDNADGSINPGCFTFAGVHPTNTCQAVIANELIKSINAQYNLNIGLIDEYSAYQNDYYNTHGWDVLQYLDEDLFGQTIAFMINQFLL